MFIARAFGNALLDFAESQNGAAMVEYGIALVVAATIGATAMTTLGGYVDTSISGTCATLTESGEGC